MANSKRLTLFPSEDQTVSNITAEFENFGGHYMLQFKGLKQGDEVLIEFEMGDSECDPYWVPLVECCGQVKAVYPKSFLILPLPMRYRAVLTDTANAYQTDPTHFEDVLIQGFSFGGAVNLSDMYHSCCDLVPAPPAENNCCENCGNAIDNGGSIGG